ncbi:MAG: hypothetical protein BAJALOKI3v1_70088 [Promethearchaeota archaeon]|nr:MAG: hypothetical protein BAJALOKI3v1_70088 [Candidatus Lokiarchaeota archaeon]
MIKSIYVLDADNKPIITYKKKENEQIEDKMLLRLTKSLNQFANGMGDHLSDFVMGENKFFFAKNSMSDTKYIIETDTRVSRKDVRPFLKKVQNFYLNEFIGTMTMSEREIKQAKQNIRSQIEEMIDETGLKIENFLKSI